MRHLGLLAQFRRCDALPGVCVVGSIAFSLCNFSSLQSQVSTTRSPALATLLVWFYLPSGYATMARGGDAVLVREGGTERNKILSDNVGCF